jgi:hypothetical protein
MSMSRLSILSCAVLLSASRICIAADCKQTLIDASNAGIVENASVAAAGVDIIVSESHWRRMPFKAKLGLAITVNCAIAGDGQSLVGIDFLSDMTNRNVGHWSPVSGLTVP